MKRVLSLLLVLALCPLLSCPALGEDRPVLTIGDLETRTSNNIDKENPLGMWQYLADLLGVELRYVYLSPDAYVTALDNGDLPDIVATNNNLSKILDSGVALDVSPYLAEYAPNFLKGDAKRSYDVFRQLGKEGDGFYFFPARIGYNGVGFSNSAGNRGYAVRWDYYKELGYPPVNNEDDYLKVLLQMHANHPYTEDGYPTYLFGSENFSGYSTAFRAEVSLDYWTSYKYQNNIFTNEIYDGYTDPAHSMWWTTMSFLNRLYRAGKENGSFDMDIFTQASEQYEAKCARGQYLGLHNAKGSFYNQQVKKDPNTLSGYGTIPSAGTNLYTNVYQLLGNGSLYMWFISANSPHWKEALGLFNLMSDPDVLREIFNGRKGVTWDYDEDGVPRMTEYGREQRTAYGTGKAPEDNYFVRWGGFSKLPSNWPVLRDNAIHPDGYPLDFYSFSREYTAATMTSNISLDICRHYGVELPSDAHYQAGGLDFRNDCGEAITSCMTSLNRDQLRILADADEILDDVWIELVLSETDEEFEFLRETVIQTLIETGEPEVFRAYRQQWDAAAAVIVPLVRQAQTANGIEPYTPEQYERFP